MYIIYVYKLMYMYMYMYVYIVYTGVPAFLISVYGTPLAAKSFLFGTAQFSLIPMLIGSRCIPDGTHTNPIWSMLQNLSKTLYTYSNYVHIHTAHRYQEIVDTCTQLRLYYNCSKRTLCYILS